jgi:hypothetical protein
MTSNATENSTDAQPSAPLSKAVIGCGVVLILLMLPLVIGFFYTAVRSPSLGTLRDAEWLSTLLANLVVMFYAFPAYTRTKDRAFLCLAFAALSFAYGVLFTVLLGFGPPANEWRVPHRQAQWYYATRHLTVIVGLVLYAYGIVSLARRVGVSGVPKA